jgi:hypothetical protein
MLSEVQAEESSNLTLLNDAGMELIGILIEEDEGKRARGKIPADLMSKFDQHKARVLKTSEKLMDVEKQAILLRQKFDAIRGPRRIAHHWGLLHLWARTIGLVAAIVGGVAWIGFSSNNPFGRNAGLAMIAIGGMLTEAGLFASRWQWHRVESADMVAIDKTFNVISRIRGGLGPSGEFERSMLTPRPSRGVAWTTSQEQTVAQLADHYQELGTADGIESATAIREMGDSRRIVAAEAGLLRLLQKRSWWLTALGLFVGVAGVLIYRRRPRMITTWTP